MNLSEFPSIQDKPSKSNLQKKIKQSNDIQDAIEDFESKGGVVRVCASFGSVPKHCSYKKVNDSYLMRSQTLTSFLPHLTQCLA